MADNCCNICSNSLEHYFNNTILFKHKIKYYKCSNCGYVRTEEPYWLEQAYQDAISLLDIGCLERNIYMSEITGKIIDRYFNRNGIFLDYAGGYGILTRLMRDKGYRFYRQDKYTKNLFARFFDNDDLNNASNKYELITAFEFLEHIQNPSTILSNLLTKTDTIFFSTLLIPKDIELSDWWYLSLETGQHISFYSKNSLILLGELLNCNFYTNNQNLHILSKKELNPNIFEFITNKGGFINQIFNRFLKDNKTEYSLQNEDFEAIKKMLNYGN